MSIIYRPAGPQLRIEEISTALDVRCHYCGANPGGACYGRGAVIHKPRRDALEAVLSGPQERDVVVVDDFPHKFHVLELAADGIVRLRLGRRRETALTLDRRQFVEYDAVAGAWRIAGHE